MKPLTAIVLGAAYAGPFVAGVIDRHATGGSTPAVDYGTMAVTAGVTGYGAYLFNKACRTGDEELVDTNLLWGAGIGAGYAFALYTAGQSVASFFM